MREILAYSDQYTRIRKDKARRLFDEGKTIFLTPSNVAASDSNVWIRPCSILRSEDESWSFDSRVNNFEYYNCNYELGYYTNFWITEEVK